MQNNRTGKKNTSIEKFSSLRIKESTKTLVSKFLDKVNKDEDCGKVTPDSLVKYFLENVTSADIEKIQLQSVTWSHEEKRLKKLWEKKKGKVTDNGWKEMLYMGQLASFIKENSRIQINQ